jgi:hypothetical protein
MWDMKCCGIPVNTEATGTVIERLEKYLEDIPRKHSIDFLHKAAVLRTSHIRKRIRSET